MNSLKTQSRIAAALYVNEQRWKEQASLGG